MGCPPRRRPYPSDSLAVNVCDASNVAMHPRHPGGPAPLSGLGASASRPDACFGTVVGSHLAVLETRVLAEERELHVTDGPVALLGDDDLGDSLLVAVLDVHLFAIDEHDDVRILLDRARVGAHDAVREPACGPRDRQVEDLVFTGGEHRDPPGP